MYKRQTIDRERDRETVTMITTLVSLNRLRHRASEQKIFDVLYVCIDRAKG